MTKYGRTSFSALAHDLKTPLTIIRGNTELLFDTSLSTEQKECAEYIENSSLQMQDYVQTLIEAAKSWDSYQPRMKKVNMDSLLLELKKQIDALYVAASIAKKHNGKIILENSAVSGGAKVTIQIPY